MKNKLVISFLIFAFVNFAEALQVDIIGACDPAALLSTAVELKDDEAVTLGDLTVKVLNENHIPFKGSAEGISQIYDSPIGDHALEVLSPSQMRAYGWCVHVDNFEPYEMPDKVMITNRVQKITWFYAYSLYDAGDWKDFCTAAWKERSLPYCSNH